ncbi:MAG TPA: hypothetical protein VHT96_09675 [Clostridia bacterium]|nr:hypothetical protein [Clostridia bacterium]
MSDDLGKKIQQIAQLLGQDEVPDNVKELVSILANSLGKKEEGISDTAQAEADSDIKQPDEDRQTAEAPVINPEILSTARNALDRFSTSGDPRINLLMAIKPFMNTRRQKKIGSCIQLLQVAGLSRMLNEHGK